MKCDLVSLAAGKIYKNPFSDVDGIFRVLDLAAGVKVTPRLGVALGVVTYEFFRNHNQVEVEHIPGFGLTAESYVFLSPSLREQPHAILTYAHFAINMWDVPKHYRLGFGVNSTLWGLHPEVEASWLREYPCYFYRKTTDYFGVHVRLGLGGWFEFGE
jgi:hypothetical protein